MLYQIMLLISLSFCQDTYDVAGYATAYGSWEFLENVVSTESPLVTYAIEAGAVPLFKSSVPQLTWGYSNHKGAVYSCLNGGFAAGAGGSGGSSIGSGAAVCLGVVPVAICEQTGSSCQAPAIANGISTVIPALGTFSRENNGLYSMESDRPGLLCRDIMSCAVFYNYMRGTSFGDPQSRDVPFGDPSKEDISTYTIGFSDNSNTTGWPEAWDTPFMGQRNNVVEALESLGANVTVVGNLAELMMDKPQLLVDYENSGIGSKVSSQRLRSKRSRP
jgi:Asp-tRNA(Asn)/Glu-tRNA(Gln) amidotransferase A subunit family amidase